MIRFNPLPYIAGIVILALGACAVGQYVDLARSREALAIEKAAHASTKQQHADQLNTLAQASAKVAQDIMLARQMWEAAETARDGAYFKELTDAKKRFEDLRGRPAVRVRIPGACPAASAAGGAAVPSVPGASAVEPAAIEVAGPVQPRVLDLGTSVSTDDVTLRYLQGYALACHQGLPPP